MPVFSYRAVDPAGKRLRGRITGASVAAVHQNLEAQGILPIEVRSVEKTPSGGGWRLGRRTAVLEFTRAVAALLPAGMPLARCLEAGAATASQAVRGRLDAVRSRVERGDPVADALAEHPALFSPLYVGVVRAGEKSGSLGPAFERLAEHLEREDELRSKLVSMSIYPALLGLVGLGAILVLVLFVLPRFADLLESSGAELPRMTALMLSLVTMAQAHWIWIALTPLILGVLFTSIRATEGGRRFLSAFLVRVPVVGGWRKQALGARFSRILGELLAGGAPLLAALDDVHGSVADPIVREETARVRTQVREGRSLNASIAEGDLFPPLLSQLASLGEESGRLADFLLKAAEMLERRTERALERLVALAEPVMIVLFGGVVGVVALALLQAIYGVNAGSF